MSNLCTIMAAVCNEIMAAAVAAAAAAGRIAHSVDRRKATLRKVRCPPHPEIDKREDQQIEQPLLLLPLLVNTAQKDCNSGNSITSSPPSPLEHFLLI